MTFHILGTTYRVNDIVIPAGDSQVVWVKWHTPSTPQSVTITVSVSGAYTAQDTFVAEIVDLNEHIPPDPTATDTNPNYTVPSLPNEPQKLTANWGVWSCYWVPVWVWCDHDDWGHWVDEGYWEYEYTGYSASTSGVMSLMPDDIVPTASGKSMKSGYGVKQDVTATLSPTRPPAISPIRRRHFPCFPSSSTKHTYAFCSGCPAAGVPNSLSSPTSSLPITGLCISVRYGSRIPQIIPSSPKSGTPGPLMEC